MMAVELKMVAEYRRLKEFDEYTELQMRLFSVKTKMDLVKASAAKDIEGNDQSVEIVHTE